MTHTCTQRYTVLALVLMFLLAQVAMTVAATAQAQESGRSVGMHQTKSAGRSVSKHSSIKKQRRIPENFISNVRFQSYPDHTRLVFDLQTKPTVQERHAGKTGHTVIEVKGGHLGQTAQTQLDQFALGPGIAVSETPSRLVAVAISHKHFRSYKILTLDKPNRLVLDLFPQGETDSQPLPPPLAEHALLPNAASGERPRALSTAPPPHSSIVTAPTDSTADQFRDGPIVTESTEPPAQAAPDRSSLSTLPPPTPRRIRTIVIDPGHGGKDPGAMGQSGLVEKDITLQVGLLLRDLLVRHGWKHTLMTRDKDVFIELEDRANYANKHEADLFVSIHVNSHPSRSTRGLEIYHFGEASDRRALEVAARENGTPLDQAKTGLPFILADLLTTKKIQESQDLAWSVKQSMVGGLGARYAITDHGVKTAPFYVIRFTTMPSILAEIAFITNPAEERLMQNSTYLSRLAEAIYEGIKAYTVPVTPAAR